MRERRRREVFEKAEKEEEREKAIFARLLLKTMLLKCCRGFFEVLKKFFKGLRGTEGGEHEERQEPP